MKYNNKSLQGFSIVELAIVLLVVSLLIGGLIASTRGFVENSRVARAKSELQHIREAIIGYAISSPNRRLPCPAEVICSAGRLALTAAGGIEQNPGGANCGANPENVWGYVPFQTLGTPDRDPWGNYYVYRIDDNYGSTIELNTDSLIDIRDSANVGFNVVARDVAAVIYSVGPNAGANPSTDEAENFNIACAGGISATIRNEILVSKALVPAGAAQPEFDDIVHWISPYLIKARIAQAGLFK